ncbi:hypothetical protein [Bacillus sp. FJAT-28004]|uniref:hypothetical protein n=1 Tax=Bacillus sp. FJAT-28004 TaxID=1679165 RepID=UPI00128F2E0B|nr:hypothetical protein [Bacillus sp. FJAT-28004]
MPYRICGRAAGLHLVVQFDEQLPDQFMNRLKEESIFAALLPNNRILLGYGHLNDQQIYEGVQRIGKAFKRSTVSSEKI